ncbi:MAG TPA: PilT/PilU family type 4a pilus ATPase [Dehalococcoidia bacterium]|nr:PilT/PilU family type 4a pilus ATPase [Dehalococcoidia bacterium]
MDVISLIREANLRKASDLHLCVSTPPYLRVNGVIRPLETAQPLVAEDVYQALEQIASEKERQEFRENLELDFGFTVEDLVRVRCNAALERGTLSLSLRLIPTVIPSLEELNLPEVCKDLARKPRGMLVISGPTGSGKSTTIAAMIEYLNQNESLRIVTIEDPIEYVFSNDQCVVIQRELGHDTFSFVQALKHVLRHDPDVVIIGEMRDVDTVSAALTVAETGHLVLTTGHAPSASQAVERIIDLFPINERALAQTRLANLMVGILCQTLVPTIDATGRVPAVEIMMANPAIRSLIREGKIHQLPNAIRTYNNVGMCLMDQALVELYVGDLISGKSLLAYCNDQTEVKKYCNSINVRLEAAETQEDADLLTEETWHQSDDLFTERLLEDK